MFVCCSCKCKCCCVKGRARIFNCFDEVPVGKNPEPFYPNVCIQDDVNCSTSSSSTNTNNSPDSPEEDNKGKSSEMVLPKSSGVYFFDAEKKKFIRQDSNRDKGHAGRSTERRAWRPQCSTSKKKRQPPEPIVLPPVYGGSCDMEAIAKRLEASLEEATPQQVNKTKTSNSPQYSYPQAEY